MNLIEIKESMLKTSEEPIKTILKTIGINPKKPLGKLNPWAWWTEITRGCNLRCGYCATRLFKYGKYDYMSITTWKNMINIIKELSPNSRLEIGSAGEPTLNPNILEMLSIAREICPTLQILIFTNGTTIANNKITYKELFNAGMDMIQVNMYAPKEIHIELARKSGYFYYEQSYKPDNFPGIFTYQKHKNIKAIRLEPNPSNWTKRKVNSGKFSTFFNNLDWNEANKLELFPIESAPNRRCDLPSKYITIFYDGSYSFCCFDFMRYTAGKLGNISDGLNGFFKFWLGKYMQDTRKKLDNKNRNSHEYCSKCNFTSIRCDIPYWKNPEIFNKYWDGKEWEKL